MENKLMTICELMNKRLTLFQENKSYDYYLENKRYFEEAVASWGNINVSSVTRDMVYFLIMKERVRLEIDGKTNLRANSMLRSLKTLFNWGNKIYGLEVRNPCQIDFSKIDKKA